MKKLLINIIYFISPKVLSDYISYIAGFRHFKISFSQFGEDLILLKYLKYKGIEKGKYLDIGAFHPRWVSNTHLLYKKGFTGHCVDIDENRLKWFKFARGKNVKTICGAVSNSHKEFIKVHKFNRKSPFSLLDTTSLEHAEHFKSKGNTKYETIKVKNFHINDIFDKVGKINVLNIDIEGKDFEVIKSSNLEIIDPEVILIEDNSGYFPLNELNDFFIKKKYHLISICGLTKCYAKK
ncbi:FkbM family methyltransferase [Candidatus Pelagibacter bacterium]|nr:FkbM family methyltransferase [Candidatus Pelagibacter bacterium]